MEFLGTLNNPEYVFYENQGQLREKLLKITSKERKRMGISKTTWFYILKRIKEGKELKLSRKTIEKLSV